MHATWIKSKWPTCVVHNSRRWSHSYTWLPLRGWPYLRNKYRSERECQQHWPSSLDGVTLRWFLTFVALQIFTALVPSSIAGFPPTFTSEMSFELKASLTLDAQLPSITNSDLFTFATEMVHFTRDSRHVTNWSIYTGCGM